MAGLRAFPDRVTEPGRVPPMLSVAPRAMSVAESVPVGHALGTSIGERLALVPAPAYEHHAQAGQHRAAEHSRTEVSTAL